MSPDVKSEETGTAAIAHASIPQPAVADDRSPRDHEESSPLFAGDEAQQLRGRWDAIQTAFVDEPRRAVENADELVASAMKRMAEIFARERENLEHQWDRGEQISTEDLRVAFQRYRSFFARILRV